MDADRLLLTLLLLLLDHLEVGILANIVDIIVSVSIFRCWASAQTGYFSFISLCLLLLILLLMLVSIRTVDIAARSLILVCAVSTNVGVGTVDCFAVWVTEVGTNIIRRSTTNTVFCVIIIVIVVITYGFIIIVV